MYIYIDEILIIWKTMRSGEGNINGVVWKEIGYGHAIN